MKGTDRKTATESIEQTDLRAREPLSLSSPRLSGSEARGVIRSKLEVDNSAANITDWLEFV